MKEDEIKLSIILYSYIYWTLHPGKEEMRCFYFTKGRTEVHRSEVGSSPFIWDVRWIIETITGRPLISILISPNPIQTNMQMPESQYPYNISQNRWH